MNSILDLSAFAVAGGVLAYQLICLQGEQRELREAINDRLGSLAPSFPALDEDTIDNIKTSIAAAVIEKLGATVPIADAVAAPAAKGDDGLPGGVSPAEARKELQAELNAMTADQIRAEIRKLPEDKRASLRSMGLSLNDARKAELIRCLINVLT
jgi:hypothetical protein